MTDGGIKGDISGLEDPTAIDKIKELIKKKEEVSLKRLILLKYERRYVKPNMENYDKTYREFRLNVPEYYNYGFDVIDKWAED